MVGVDINTLTMEQYLALSRENQASGVVKPEIKGNANFEIKSQFMREFREYTFSRNKNEDAHDHIDRVLIIHILDQKELNMRQRRWIELLNDCDYDFRYHLRKANVIKDALCRKERMKPLGVRALVMTLNSNLPSCYNCLLYQNRSLIHPQYNKTPYELHRGRKLDLKFLHVFGALCYPTNNGKDLGELKPKSDIGIFIGYSPAKKAYQIYNKQKRLILETIHVQFDELTAMASE
nr:retrovirus-related Pol polyprotein from transposon TNT 1-94 [Tanacetum cinerariifolium]